MLLSLNWLADYITVKKTAKEIAEKITLSLSEVEKIYKIEDDTILEIENKALTHRPDCFSQVGLAREIAAFFNLSFVDPAIKLSAVKFIPLGKEMPLKVNLKNPFLCSRYCAIVLNNIHVKPSPVFIQKRLKACNIRPINNVVDITNYVMLALGQPLHAFCYLKITNHEIIVRPAHKNELLVTLDNQKRILDDSILVIADSDKPIALAGIMGGKNSEVNDKTTTIVIESANFNPQVTRISAKKLNLRTEAVTRFEKNLDPDLSLPALAMAVELLQKYAQATISSKLIDQYPVKNQNFVITTTSDYINTVLGLRLSTKEILVCLKRLQLIAKEKNNKIYVPIPSFRRDLHLEADLAEEVARIHGYDNIPTTLPRGIIQPPAKNHSLSVEKKVKQLLSNLGLNEVNTPSLISKELIELTNDDPVKYLKLLNPASPDRTYFRKSLIPSLLSTAKNNLRYFDEFALFEIARIFNPTKKNQLPQEKKFLTAVFVGKTFFEAKGILEALYENLNIPFPEIHAVKNHQLLNPVKSARIPENGLIGELNYRTTDYLATKKPVAIFEVNFEQLVSLTNLVKYYQTIPSAPPVIEDLSFEFPQGTKIGGVISAIKNSSSLISDLQILDKYQNTITFRIKYQDTKKSLSSEDVKPLRRKIIELAVKHFKAKLRS